MDWFPSPGPGAGVARSCPRELKLWRDSPKRYSDTSCETQVGQLRVAVTGPSRLATALYILSVALWKRSHVLPWILLLSRDSNIPPPRLCPPILLSSLCIRCVRKVSCWTLCPCLALHAPPQG